MHTILRQHINGIGPLLVTFLVGLFPRHHRHRG